MQLIKRTNLRLLLADEGKHIRAINDVYEPSHIDENGYAVEEHYPYYAEMIFLGEQIKEEDIEDLYIEENIESE